MADCQDILPWIKPGWVGVEIGVCRAESAVAFLKHGVRFMYLVDPWLDYPGYLEQTSPNNYQCALVNLAPYQDRHAIFRMPSGEAERFIPMVDFVWVDGNHRYEWVKSDLEYYWPKIRAGGVLCGHDYVDNGPDSTCQVAKAVNEFAADRSRRLELALPCWVIQKVVW